MDSCKREIEVKIPWEDVHQESNRIVASFRHQARVPGFRRGKAPDSVVRSHYQKEIRQELIDQGWDFKVETGRLKEILEEALWED